MSDDEYVKGEEIIEASWTCPSCQRVNRGRDMRCTACGAPKEESSKYDVDVHAAKVEDAAVAALAGQGEHWTCDYCGTQNRAGVTGCVSCGVDRTTGRKAKPAEPIQPAAAPPPKKKSRALLYVLIGVVGLIGLVMWLGAPKKLDARVAALDWSHVVHVQVKTVVHKEAWRDEMAAGAYNTSCTRRQRGTRQVVDHYQTVSKTRDVKVQSGSHEECREEVENLKDGFAKRRKICRQVPNYTTKIEHYTEQVPVHRAEPVFADFCRYDADEWPEARAVKREGTGTKGLAWPPDKELALKSNERAVKEAKYKVTFEDPKKPDHRPVYEAKTPEEFAGFEVGQTHRIQVDSKGKVTLLPPK